MITLTVRSTHAWKRIISISISTSKPNPGNDSNPDAFWLKSHLCRSMQRVPSADILSSIDTALMQAREVSCALIDAFTLSSVAPLRQVLNLLGLG